MNHIEIGILNPGAIKDAERLMVCAARLTQSGHKIKNWHDFERLYAQPYSDATVRRMALLPHPTIQKFGVINVAVIGASRRFLAQITRHQNEVKFMSASLQYSDYSGAADFVVPYEVYAKGQGAVDTYLWNCRSAATEYMLAVEGGLNNDAAGYMMPQGMRNVLIISATPFQWRHMIKQRTCRRNTSETRYVMLKIWDELQALAPEWFGVAAKNGPFCMSEFLCKEGHMSCKNPIDYRTPSQILEEDFPAYYKKEEAPANGD